MNSPGWQGPSMILEISGKITPERIKGWSQGKNNTQLWTGLVILARSDAVKSNIAQIIIELFNFSFFGIRGWGIDLDYCDVEQFALEMNQDYFVVFEIAPKYCISDFFVDYDGYSISSKGFLPTVVDVMVI